MVTAEEQLQILEEQKAQAQKLVAQPIPQRRFGSPVTREFQQRIVESRQAGREALVQIKEAKEKVGEFQKQAEEFKVQQEKRASLEEDIRIAKALAGKAVPLTGLTPRQRQLVLSEEKRKEAEELRFQQLKTFRERGLTPIFEGDKIVGFASEELQQSFLVENIGILPPETLRALEKVQFITIEEKKIELTPEEKLRGLGLPPSPLEEALGIRFADITIEKPLTKFEKVVRILEPVIRGPTFEKEGEKFVFDFRTSTFVPEAEFKRRQKRVVEITEKVETVIEKEVEDIFRIFGEKEKVVKAKEFITGAVGAAVTFPIRKPEETALLLATGTALPGVIAGFEAGITSFLGGTQAAVSAARGVTISGGGVLAAKFVADVSAEVSEAATFEEKGRVVGEAVTIVGLIGGVRLKRPIVLKKFFPELKRTPTEFQKEFGLLGIEPLKKPPTGKPFAFLVEEPIVIKVPKPKEVDLRIDLDPEVKFKIRQQLARFRSEADVLRFDSKTGTFQIVPEPKPKPKPPTFDVEITFEQQRALTRLQKGLDLIVFKEGGFEIIEKVPRFKKKPPKIEVDIDPKVISNLDFSLKQQTLRLERGLDIIKFEEGIPKIVEAPKPKPKIKPVEFDIDPGVEVALRQRQLRLERQLDIIKFDEGVARVVEAQKKQELPGIRKLTLERLAEERVISTKRVAKEIREFSREEPIKIKRVEFKIEEPEFKPTPSGRQQLVQVLKEPELRPLIKPKAKPRLDLGFSQKELELFGRFKFVLPTARFGVPEGKIKDIRVIEGRIPTGLLGEAKMVSALEFEPILKPVQRQAQLQQLLQEPLTKTIQKQTQRNKQVLLFRFKEEQLTGLTQPQLVAQLEKDILKFAQPQAFVPVQIQRARLRQLERELVLPKLTLKEVLREPKVSGLIIPLKKRKPKKVIKKPQSYHVFARPIKRKGQKQPKLIRVTKKPIKKSRARDLRNFLLDTSLARTGKISPSQQKPRRLDLDVPIGFASKTRKKFRTFKQVKGKRKPLGRGKVIEKGKFLLDTTQEKRQITLRKRIAQLRKKAKPIKKIKKSKPKTRRKVKRRNALTFID